MTKAERVQWDELTRRNEHLSREVDRLSNELRAVKDSMPVTAVDVELAMDDLEALIASHVRKTKRTFMAKLK